MAVEVGTSHQHSIMFCCHVTNDSRGSLCQNSIWHRSAYEAKMSLNSSMQKKSDTHWHSSTVAEHLWRPNIGCEHSEAVGGVVQQWWHQQWLTSAGADFYDHGMQAFVQDWQQCIANGADYVAEQCFVTEFSLSNSFIVLFASVAVSTEINRRHYFSSDLGICFVLLLTYVIS